MTDLSTKPRILKLKKKMKEKRIIYASRPLTAAQSRARKPRGSLTLGAKPNEVNTIDF